MKYYVADFETTTNSADCHVWAYAICEVGNNKKENVIVGTSIDEFMDWCSRQKDNPTVFFHNLKFDSQFIMYWLFHNGFEHVEERAERKTKTFATLISDKGMYYSLEVVFYRKGKNISRVIFQDSLKLIPLSVDAIAKSFHLETQKLEIDYKSHDNLPAGSPLTPEEDDYIRHDVLIVAHAVAYFHSRGLNKMTIGSCAMDEYKKLITKNAFKRYFPVPEYHDDVAQSYRGGFTYLNPKYAGKMIGNGIVLDVNSLYPSVMYQEYLPFGTPIFFEGQYQKDELYPLYTQMLRCSFEIKPGKIPTVQIKGSLMFRGNEYLTSSNDDEVVLCLNSVDLELFFEHYNVYNVEYISGWKFKASKGLFNEYIDKWSSEKIAAKERGDHGMYLLSKLYLNSLYGKFGSSNKVKSKIPYLGEDDVIHFRDSDEQEKDGVYIAMASFITSYARRKTITAAQTITDNYNAGKSKIEFVYADTDSLHCVSPDFALPDGLQIHSTDLGAWDFEMSFRKGKYLRQKCYVESEIISEKDYYKGKYTESGQLSENHMLYSKDSDGFYKMKITVAGMPTSCHNQVTFQNFKLGATYKGKLQPKLVRGGVILRDVDFTIKR